MVGGSGRLSLSASPSSSQSQRRLPSTLLVCHHIMVYLQSHNHYLPKHTGRLYSPGPGWGSLILSTDPTTHCVSLVGFTRWQIHHLPRFAILRSTSHPFPRYVIDTGALEEMIKISGEPREASADFHLAFCNGWRKSTTGLGLSFTSVVQTFQFKRNKWETRYCIYLGEHN